MIEVIDERGRNISKPLDTNAKLTRYTNKLTEEVNAIKKS